MVPELVDDQRGTLAPSGAAKNTFLEAPEPPHFAKKKQFKQARRLDALTRRRPEARRIIIFLGVVSWNRKTGLAAGVPAPGLAAGQTRFLIH